MSTDQLEDEFVAGDIETDPLLVRSPQASRPTPLPKVQLGAVYAIKLILPIAQTQVLPYLNVLVQELAKSDGAKTGYYSGVVGSATSVSHLLTIYLWGRISDRIGRIPVIVLGTTGIAVFTLLFGLSRTFATVLLTRFLVGIFSGTTGAIHSVVGEITDASNQSTAFPLYDIVSALGFVIGDDLLLQTTHWWNFCKPRHPIPSVVRQSILENISLLSTMPRHCINRYAYAIYCCVRSRGDPSQQAQNEGHVRCPLLRGVILLRDGRRDRANYSSQASQHQGIIVNPCHPIHLRIQRSFRLCWVVLQHCVRPHGVHTHPRWRARPLAASNRPSTLGYGYRLDLPETHNAGASPALRDADRVQVLHAVVARDVRVDGAALVRREAGCRDGEQGDRVGRCGLHSVHVESGLYGFLDYHDPYEGPYAWNDVSRNVKRHGRVRAVVPRCAGTNCCQLPLRVLGIEQHPRRPAVGDHYGPRHSTRRVVRRAHQEVPRRQVVCVSDTVFMSVDFLQQDVCRLSVLSLLLN